MKKFFFLFTFSLLLAFFLTPNFIQAKKKIVRKLTSGGVVANSRLIIKPKLRTDRQALIVNFSSLSAVSYFTYELSYNTDGIPQGVAGSLTPSGEESIERELLFGTCPKNVCRYHRNIKNMKFVTVSTLTSGVKVRKTFQVRP